MQNPESVLENVTQESFFEYHQKYHQISAPRPDLVLID